MAMQVRPGGSQLEHLAKHSQAIPARRSLAEPFEHAQRGLRVRVVTVVDDHRAVPFQTFTAHFRRTKLFESRCRI